MNPLHVETSVKDRYSAGAQAREASLCCPVDYDPQYLAVIPEEVIARDYGCGDPSQYLRPGETVLDLGSGTGKICFIAAQVVGPGGRVIGVDMTDAMLEVARRNAPIIAERLGFANVEFRRGRIQDLALDLERLDAELASRPITDANTFLAAHEFADELRRTHPLIAANSIDVAVSNCVLNLVEPRAKEQLFAEIFRVLRPGGRAVISDIVSDEAVPAALQNDPELWSGCISGALTETGFLEAFTKASFYGVQILKRDVAPWRTVEGIEFRALTIEAFKGEQGAALERNQAVIYRGPFKSVLDDDGNTMERGERSAVCDKTFQRFQRAPYRECFELIEPHTEIPLEAAAPFECAPGALRHPRQSKGAVDGAASESSGCGDNGQCC